MSCQDSPAGPGGAAAAAPAAGRVAATGGRRRHGRRRAAPRDAAGGAGRDLSRRGRRRRVDPRAWRRGSRALAAGRLDVVTRGSRGPRNGRGGRRTTLPRRAPSRRAPPSGPWTSPGGQEVAVPIRWDDGVVAALVARWDRAPAEAAAWLAGGGRHPGVSRARPRCASSRTTRGAPTLAPGLLGRSAAMAAVRAAVARAGPAPFAVLIHGESGVGKELVARAVHAMSARHTQRICDVNCAALPDDLLESELFGYVARRVHRRPRPTAPGCSRTRTAGRCSWTKWWTCRRARRRSCCACSSSRRCGGSARRGRAASTCASSAPPTAIPREAAAAGAFRPDLVYRLDVIRIAVPPLRERREDVRRTGRSLLARGGRRASARAPTLGRDAVEALDELRLAGQRARAAERAGRDGRVGAARRAASARATCPRTARRAGASRGAATARGRAPRVRTACRAWRRWRAPAGHRGRAARELGLSRQGLLKLMARVGVAGPRTDAGGRRISAWARSSRAAWRSQRAGAARRRDAGLLPHPPDSRAIRRRRCWAKRRRRPTSTALRSKLGLDRPLLEQYGAFLGGLARGDLGTSLRTGEPVAQQIWLRAPGDRGTGGRGDAGGDRRRHSAGRARRRAARHGRRLRLDGGWR